MWLLQTWKLTNPETSLLYNATKERWESLIKRKNNSGAEGFPRHFRWCPKPAVTLCPPSVRGTVPKEAGLLHGYLSSISLARTRGCVQLVWEQDTETTVSSFSCPTISSNQVCCIRWAGVLVSCYVIQKEKAFTFGSSRCKPGSLLVQSCLKTLNHIQLRLLTVARLRIIQLQPRGTPLKRLCTARENINCSVKAK